MRRVIVTYEDLTGLPRAYASGPADRLDEVKAVAREEAEAYRQEKEELQHPNPLKEEPTIKYYDTEA